MIGLISRVPLVRFRFGAVNNRMTGIMFDYGWIEGRCGDRSVKCRIGMGSGNHTKRGMLLRMFATHQSGAKSDAHPKGLFKQKPSQHYGF